MKHKLILFTVGLIGAVILMIEVGAVRILAPYFGNSIYTVSSMFTVVLGALGIGYYVGGVIGDAKPREDWFYSLVMLGGLSVLVTEVVRARMLDATASTFGNVGGPLVMSALLFALPSFFLGTIAPFATKLSTITVRKDKIGRAAGEIFFVGTLGSITGSFLTGFVLIPRVGMDSIILGGGALIIGMAFLGLVLAHSSKAISISIMLVACVGGAYGISGKAQATEQNVIYEHAGVYEHIRVEEGEQDGKKARFLFQDKNPSAAIFLESEEPAYEYSKYARLDKIFTPEAKQVLVLGGGAYVIPKAFLDAKENMHVDVVEIEPGLFKIAQTFFGLKETNRLTNYIEDARVFLNNTDKKYDVIILDVYQTLYTIPPHLATQEFMTLMKEHLNPEGIVIANTIGRLGDEKDSLTPSLTKTFRSVFENDFYFAVNSPETESLQNIIMVGWNENEKKALKEIQQKEQNPDPWLESIGQKEVNHDRLGTKHGTLFTDTFAPVEYLTAKLLKTTLEL